MSSLCYIGLGSNLDNPVRQLQRAIDRFHAAETLVKRVSSVYRSPPWGPVVDQPYFYNAVLACETSLTPLQLLQRCLATEQAMGRIRRVGQGPRVIDLDLLLMGETVGTWPQLTLPHPRMTQRAFVLRPLLQLEPQLVHPGDGVRFSSYLEQIQFSQPVELLENSRLSIA